MTTTPKPLTIDYAVRFTLDFTRAPRDIQVTFLEVLQLFHDNPEHPALRTHALRERYAGFRSIDVTDDWRAIYKEVTTGGARVITFYFLGTHKQLYG
jgi:addiction module RelE/StbE family toxin